MVIIYLLAFAATYQVLPFCGKSKQLWITFSTWGCFKITLTLLVHQNYKACLHNTQWSHGAVLSLCFAR